MSSRLGAFGMTAALVMGVGTSQCAPAASSPQAEIITITNQRRAEAGVGPVTVDAILVGAAQRHSEDQARNDAMSHYGSDGSDAGSRIASSGYQGRGWGENVASGYTDAAAVMSGWMASPGHRVNVLNGAFTDVGIGLAYAADGTPYWTMELGQP